PGRYVPGSPEIARETCPVSFWMESSDLRFNRKRISQLTRFLVNRETKKRLRVYYGRETQVGFCLSFRTRRIPRESKELPMGIFSRLSDLIVANINALLDKAENPERMLAQIIREMEEGLGRARQQAATAIALDRRLKRELQQHQQEAFNWKEPPRLALASNREDLVRQALARKIEHDDLAHGLLTQYSSAQETSSQVRAALRALELRLAEARRKQKTLLARHRAAKIQLEVQRAAVTV